MAVINKTGISNGGTIQAEHVTRTIDALSGISTDTIIATGSFSGSLTGTATSASFATTSSYAVNAGSSVTINSNTNNYIITATGTSNTLQGESNLTFDGTTLIVSGSTRITGSLGVTGSTALSAPAAFSVTGTTRLNGPVSGSITGSNNLVLNLSTLGTSGQFILPTTEPTSPTRGSIYWNFSTGYLFIYDGTTWLKVQLTVGG